MTSDDSTSLPPEGWWDDPYGDPYLARWWDGNQWTEHTRDKSQVSGPGSNQDPPGRGRQWYRHPAVITGMVIGLLLFLVLAGAVGTVIWQIAKLDPDVVAVSSSTASPETAQAPESSTAPNSAKTPSEPESPTPTETATPTRSSPTPSPETADRVMFVSEDTVGEGCPVHRSGVGVWITPDCLAGEWPLTVERALVYCRPPSAVFVGISLLTEHENTQFAVNGLARSHYPNVAEVEEIWRDDPEIEEEGWYISIGHVIDLGLELCE